MLQVDPPAPGRTGSGPMRKVWFHSQHKSKTKVADFNYIYLVLCHQKRLTGYIRDIGLLYFKFDAVCFILCTL